MSLKTRLLWTFIISSINLGSEANWEWNRHDYVQEARPGQIPGYFSAPTEPSVPNPEQRPFQVTSKQQPQPQYGYVNVPDDFYPACECERYCFDIPQIYLFAVCSEVYEFLACANDQKSNTMGLSMFYEKRCGNCGRYKSKPDYNREGLKPEEHNREFQRQTNGRYNIRPMQVEFNNKAEFNKAEFKAHYNKGSFRAPMTVSFAKPYTVFLDEHKEKAPVNFSVPDPSPLPH